jgi:hypothetical protein
MNKKIALLALIALSLASAQEGWWMREPIRWIQTNLRETDAKLDPKRLVDQLAEFRANVLHYSMGGIVAQYPTKVPFHYPSPHLPPGRDTLREVLDLAHSRGIRLVGRFDLSKTPKEVFDAHPEWFFRKANGDPVVYNGLYSTCINGGYYRDHGMKILAEALENYDVDGLFFNMFGNQSRDYSGNFVGHCHCDSCKRKYRELYGKELPKEPDEEYRQFMFRSSREVAAEIGRLIHSKRPNAGYFNYIQEYTDGIMSESNTAVNRPLPLWPYNSSDNVNRARNSQPGKMSINLCMQFVDFPWRFATVPQQEIALRLWQNVAHGGALAFAVNGTLDHEDMQAIEAAKPVFQWLAEHEQYYSRQVSAAKVALLGGSARTGRTFNYQNYRGAFRFLSEEHIPFAVSDNMDWLGERQFDLVIATDWAPPELSKYVEQGGRVLIVSSRPPEFPVAAVTKTWRDVEGYFRVRNHQAFPSLKSTNLVMLHGNYTEVEGDGSDSLTFVPPSMFGPPEKIHIDQVNTTKPGLVWRNYGRGQVAWIPWDLAALYYKHSLPAHGGILRDVVNRLLPERQVVTNAHPLLEMSLMRQGGRTLLHLINLSGHSQTAYFQPVPMRDIEIAVEGKFTIAKSIRNAAALTLRPAGSRTSIALPEIGDYELIVLE